VGRWVVACHDQFSMRFFGSVFFCCSAFLGGLRINPWSLALKYTILFVRGLVIVCKLLLVMLGWGVAYLAFAKLRIRPGQTQRVT
jgi:hypothetical protein